MSLTWISTVTVGCLLMASLVLTQDYRRRDFRKFGFSKSARPLYNNGAYRKSNVRRYRVISSDTGAPGSPKMAGPYNNQPAYIGSKTAYNEYNDNRQRNNPYSVQGNKGGNTDLYKGPYGVTQGTPTVTDAYKNQPSYTERIKNSQEYKQYNNQPNNGPDPNLYKAPYGVTQGTLTVADAYKNQPTYTDRVENSQEYTQDNSQPNNGPDPNVYKDGVKQGGLTVTVPYNNQPGYTGIDPYIKNSPESNQYSNQDNKGSYDGVYDGNQAGYQAGYPLHN